MLYLPLTKLKTTRGTTQGSRRLSQHASKSDDGPRRRGRELEGGSKEA